MHRILRSLALALCLVCTLAAAASATEVKLSGDVRVYGAFWQKPQYTGWNYNGTRTQDAFTVFERVRVRADFIANEALRFRLSWKSGDIPWGASTFTVDNPTTVLKVYQAYMQFRLPGTQVEFTVGQQDMELPTSAGWLDANPVFGGTRTTAAMVKLPFSEQFSLVGGFTRLLDANKDFDLTTTQVPDELDGYILTLPVTLEGFQATPWAMLAVAGRNAGYGSVQVGNGGYSNETLATNLLSAASMGTAATWRNSQNAYWWVGSTFALTALDPFKFYADVVYGSGNDTDRARFRRHGLFVDLAAEYTGFASVTPQLTIWYSPGEDSSARNGSERLPSVVDYWCPSNSFLFDGDQPFNNEFMNINPVGAYGFVAALDKISFMQNLTHRITVSYAHGTNSPAALRAANASQGTGNYVQMGRDLSDKEYAVGISLDNQYDIYSNLALILDTGWSHGSFQTSVWGHRFTEAARRGDAFKVMTGIKYKF
ncbi:outer membrane homotrimeric porin [Fundidesulfovibrio soli]|uniref:outer membrane homotrimeric porin n=1 Tax=Fundidesulfovibrio soli TaxID=2922716 RepID=UPI001FB04970|nr:outer membrane homotrimeric porin [Fundidesulfovibrio soli]